MSLMVALPVLAGSIQYGYNANGDYVPISINGQRVQYGYNAHGDYVPTSIGGQRVQYGYNANGDYVPTSIGGDRIQYGYNAMVITHRETMSQPPSGAAEFNMVIMQMGITFRPDSTIFNFYIKSSLHKCLYGQPLQAPFESSFTGSNSRLLIFS